MTFEMSLCAAAKWLLKISKSISFSVSKRCSYMKRIVPRTVKENYKYETTIYVSFSVTDFHYILSSQSLHTALKLTSFTIRALIFLVTVEESV